MHLLLACGDEMGRLTALRVDVDCVIIAANDRDGNGDEAKLEVV